MEQLSSCYFCGAALDAQIESYHVVPSELESTEDQQRAVSLCPSCRQKLAHVVETVVAATDADAPESVADDVATPEPSGDLLENAAGSDGPDEVDETVDARDEASASASTPARDARRASADSQQTDSQPSDMSADRSEGSGTVDRTRSGHSSQETETGGSDDPLSTDSHPSSSQAESDASAPAQTNGTESDTSDDDGPSLTALEYNKVMRLLQNREFPVERSEIHDIATSAYQISDQEFDAIIDAAIERGLIGEENGQLVSGE